MYSKLDNFWKLFFCNFGKMGKFLDFDILQPIWSIRYSESFSTCFQTKFHFRNIEFVNNLVRYNFGSVISVSVIFFRFSVFRYFGKNTVSVEHYPTSSSCFFTLLRKNVPPIFWTRNGSFNSSRTFSAKKGKKRPKKFFRQREIFLFFFPLYENFVLAFFVLFEAVLKL